MENVASKNVLLTAPMVWHVSLVLRWMTCTLALALIVTYLLSNNKAGVFFLKVLVIYRHTEVFKSYTDNVIILSVNKTTIPPHLNNGLHAARIHTFILKILIRIFDFGPPKNGLMAIIPGSWEGSLKNKCPVVRKFPKVMFNLKVLTQNLRSMNKNYILQPLHPL